jgi:tetratricopeptide (TPR) repeat protein
LPDTIFINYRREDSISTAGRLHDRLAQTFGKKNLFMDVDSIPAGVDFVEHLSNQVAACNVVLVVIGRNWLNARDESGERRLDDPDDFVAIEIAAALARDIRVIPVLVDGARMPKPRELPDSLKPLARRQAVEVRHTHFAKDAEALVARMREALGNEVAGPARWRVGAVAGVTAMAVLLLGLWAATTFVQNRDVRQAEMKWEEERRTIAAEANRKVEQTEQQRLATLNVAEQERQTRGAAEAEAKRKTEEAEQQRLAAIKTEQERQARAAAEGEAKHKADEAEQQQLAAAKAEQERQTRAAAEAEAKRKAEEAKKAFDQGTAAVVIGDNDRAIADFNQAIRLNPTYALAFGNRGFVYARKDSNDRAIADFNEAIRLDPTYAIAFRGRGVAYGNKGDYDRAIADFTEAIRLDPKLAPAFSNRGLAYERKGSFDRAIADYNEAIRLNPTDATSFCRRGRAKLKINEQGGEADIARAKQLDAAAFCR